MSVTPVPLFDPANPAAFNPPHASVGSAVRLVSSYPNGTRETATGFFIGNTHFSFTIFTARHNVIQGGQVPMRVEIETTNGHRFRAGSLAFPQAPGDAFDFAVVMFWPANLSPSAPITGVAAASFDATAHRLGANPEPLSVTRHGSELGWNNTLLPSGASGSAIISGPRIVGMVIRENRGLVLFEGNTLLDKCIEEAEQKLP